MDSLYKLDGKTALVTGSAQGIGKDIALVLAQAGANIVVNDVNSEIAEQTANEIQNLGVRALVHIADITDSDSVKQMVQRISKEFSTIDILINNAGITRDGYIMRMTDEQLGDVAAQARKELDRGT